MAAFKNLLNSMEDEQLIRYIDEWIELITTTI